MVFDTDLSEDRQLVAAEALVSATAYHDVPSGELLPAVRRLSSVVDESSDALARRRAVFALAGSRDPASLPSIARAAADDPDPRVRGAAILTLGRLDDELAYTHLLESAVNGDPSPQVRKLASQALRQVGSDPGP